MREVSAALLLLEQGNGTLDKHGRANANVALAQMQQAESQLALVEEKLARASIVAPLDAWRVILKVEDRDTAIARLVTFGGLALLLVFVLGVPMPLRRRWRSTKTCSASA